VRHEAIRLFGPDEAPAVLSAFSTAYLPSVADNTERIQLAILLLCRKDRSDFSELLDIATEDWRDVLIGAGLAGENWRDVVRKSGIPLP
jgi:hypothetical protein